MKHLLFMFLVLALVPTFALEYVYSATTDATGKIQKVEDFDGYNVRLMSFKSNKDFANVTVSFNTTTLFNGAVKTGTSYPLSGRATSIGINASGGPANTATEIRLYFSLTLAESEFNFISSTDTNGCLVKSGKIVGNDCQLNSFYSSHSYAYVHILADENPVFSGAVQAGIKYDIQASVTKNWVIFASGGPCEKKIQMIFQHQEAGMMASDIERKGFTYPVSGTTNQNGDVSIPDHVIDTTSYNVQVTAFSTNVDFQKVMLILDGHPILPKSGTNTIAGKMYLINVKLNPGAHTVGVIAEGGSPETATTFVFMCHE